MAESRKTEKKTSKSLVKRIQHITDQGVGAMNEDALLVNSVVGNKHRFAVFDGATSLDRYTDSSGKTGGYLAANIARETFARSTGTLEQATLAANKAIGQAIESSGVTIHGKENRWVTGFAAVDIDPLKKTFDWAQIADCLILTINKDGSYRVLMSDYDHDREMMIKWKRLVDRGVQDKFEILKPDIIALRREGNVTYGVLNGEPEGMKFMRSGKEPLRDVASILIFTDGLIPPKTNPEQEDDFSPMVEHFKRGGLEAVKKYIRALEDSDPNCERFPRYKKSDDIGAIALSF